MIFLKNIFYRINVKLVDFKLEFGRLKDGTIVLADEISPDTCRFWDAQTQTKSLIKTVSAAIWADVEDAYNEMMKRVFGRLILGGINEQFKRRMRSIRSILGGDRATLQALAYYGLFALQHRGQESCGIVVNDDGVFNDCIRIRGLVKRCFYTRRAYRATR